MKDLVADMLKEAPAERPTINEVVTRFHDISTALHWWTLRRPIHHRQYPSAIRLFRMLPIALHNVRYILSRISAIPACPSVDSIA